MSDEDMFLIELKQTFLDELDEVLSQIESAFLRFEREPANQPILHEIFRYFHNVKGSSKTVGISVLSHFAHQAETLLDKMRNGDIFATPAIVDALIMSSDLMRNYAIQLRTNTEDPKPLQDLAEHLLRLMNAKPTNSSDRENQGDAGFGIFEDPGESPPAEPPLMSAPNTMMNSANQPKLEAKTDEFLKVSTSKINRILDLFGEQVILQSVLGHEIAKEEVDYTFIKKSLAQLKKITQDLQYTMVSLRMVPLEGLFGRMERAVRDVARLTGKAIEFQKQGQSSELDKTILDALIDPLTHMVRNAADHGIESIEQRQTLGKPQQGLVKLTALRSGGAFEISVTDDGKGLNRQSILEKAKSKGMIKSNAPLSDAQVFDFIFASGFSTLENATEISGRGVGMDVVKQQITKLKGTCDISSELGKGSKFTIRVPLSLAMFRGTIVAVNGERYVIPNSDFSETIKISLSSICANPGSEKIIRTGSRILRIIDLRERLRIGNSPSKQPTASESFCLGIVAVFDGESYAFLVNDILTQEQIVLKELGPEAKEIRGASGGTILGDGKVALVLDIAAIVRRERVSSRKKVA